MLSQTPPVRLCHGCRPGATEASGEDSSRLAPCASVRLLSQVRRLQWELPPFLEQERDAGLEADVKSQAPVNGPVSQCSDRPDPEGGRGGKERG